MPPYTPPPPWTPRVASAAVDAGNAQRPRAVGALPEQPFDVNDERTDDVKGAKECFVVFVEGDEQHWGGHYQALSPEGGTLPIARVHRIGTLDPCDVTCYSPDDDSVYFDCEETSMQRMLFLRRRVG